VHAAEEPELLHCGWFGALAELEPPSERVTIAAGRCGVDGAPDVRWCAVRELGRGPDRREECVCPLASRGRQVVDEPLWPGTPKLQDVASAVERLLGIAKR
jgi:hypothetical protein